MSCEVVAAIRAFAARSRSESSITKRRPICGLVSMRPMKSLWRIAPTSTSVSVLIDAERSDESSIDISPKKSPSLRIERIVSRPSGATRHTATEPEAIT